LAFGVGIETHAKEVKRPKLGQDDAKIQEYIARKHYTTAARLITSKKAEAWLVKGHLFLRADQAKDALHAFSRIDDISENLRDFLHLRRAQAFLMVESPQEALAALKKIKHTQLYQATYDPLIARALRESGDIEGARKAYTALSESDRKSQIPKALIGLARLESDAGHASRAIQALKKFDIEYPTHWMWARVKPLLNTLLEDAPGAREIWENRTVEEQLTQAEKVLDAHRNQRAIKLLKPLEGRVKTSDMVCRQRYALGKALRKVRRWREARPILENAVIVCEKAEHALAPWARYLAFKAAERLADEEASAEHNRKLMATFPQHRLADDAGYALIRHLLEDKKDLKAAELLIGKLVKRFPKGDMMTDAVFWVAIHAFSDKKYKTALRVLNLESQLEAGRPDDGQMGRTDYWKARSHAKLGRRTKARKLYIKALTEYPLSWYSVLSYSRLREMNRKKADDLAKKAFKSSRKDQLKFLNRPALDGTRWTHARALAKLGLTRPAMQLLKGIRSDDETTQWQIAQLLDKAGAYHLSHNVLRRKLEHFRRHRPTGKNADAWRVAYPFPFEKLMDSKASLVNVDPDLARSITREESGFNASIESFANAMGLMQLILPTAKNMARKGEGTINRNTLSQPDLNVTLGTRYLAHVGKHTGAVETLIPPGYNAGAGRLKKWLQTYSKLPLDLFVERIPYEEAKGYTKRVNSTRAIYKYLYGTSQVPMYIGQNLKKTSPKTKKRKTSKKVKARRKRSKKR